MFKIKMFIRDGKSLFGNIGLLLSLVILILLLITGYHKCLATENFYLNTKSSSNNMVNSNNKVNSNYNNVIEKFGSGTAPVPKDVRVIIDKSSVVLKFSCDVDSNQKYPEKFLIVLAQYDINTKNTGKNLFYISTESVINPDVGYTQDTTGNGILNNSFCTMINGVPSCQYKFDNLDIRDSNGDLYKYKIGVASIYANDNYSIIVVPENLESTYFSLEKSIDEQNKIYKEFDEFKKSRQEVKEYNNTMASATGDYELIKKQLGNYPDALFINEAKINQDSLQDLVNKSMALGKINVNVN